MKMRTVSGFTLIELIVVIAILAILSVIAIPRFLDLRQNAAAATASGIAGAIASGSAVNYAGRLAGNAAATAVLSCGHASRVVGSGTALPVGASIVSAVNVANGATTVCTVNYTNGGVSATATFDIVGAT